MWLHTVSKKLIQYIRTVLGCSLADLESLPAVIAMLHSPHSDRLANDNVQSPLTDLGWRRWKMPSPSSGAGKDIYWAANLFIGLRLGDRLRQKAKSFLQKAFSNRNSLISESTVQQIKTPRRINYELRIKAFFHTLCTLKGLFVNKDSKKWFFGLSFSKTEFVLNFTFYLLFG